MSSVGWWESAPHSCSGTWNIKALHQLTLPRSLYTWEGTWWIPYWLLKDPLWRNTCHTLVLQRLTFKIWCGNAVQLQIWTAESYKISVHITNNYHRASCFPFDCCFFSLYLHDWEIQNSKQEQNRLQRTKSHPKCFSILERELNVVDD